MKKIILTILVFLIVISTSLGDLTAGNSTSWNDTLFPIIDRGDKNNIDTVIDNLSDVKNEVTGSGNVKQAANDFREQLNYRALGNAQLIREVVEENLKWLREREGPFEEFAGQRGNRCVYDTHCYNFREDLSTLFMEVAEQGANFEIIDKLGLDGSRATNIINKTPPIILFGIYEVMSRIPDWQNLPDDLQSIFDEIGDRDVFSVRLNENETSTSTLNGFRMAALIERTPTQRFCETWENRVDNEMDQVRLSRIKSFIFYYVTMLELAESLTSETIGGTVVGEGSDTVIPNPLKAQLKGILSIIKVIQNQAVTFRSNLNSCRTSRREIELQVAQCLPLADFVMPSKRDEVYMIVKTKVQNAADENLSVSLSEASLTKAETFRNQGKYKQAYFKICDAYSQIGS